MVGGIQLLALEHFFLYFLKKGKSAVYIKFDLRKESEQDEPE
jgi:hypothetical protein